MIDVVKRKEEELSAKTLEKKLGCPVCEISAINGDGIPQLKEAVSQLMAKGRAAAPKYEFAYSEDVREALTKVRDSYLAAEGGNVAVRTKTLKDTGDFVALKLLSADKTIIKEDDIPQSLWDEASEVRTSLEKKYDDDFDSIIAEQRYTWIKSIIDSVIVKRRKEKISISDKIDKVLTNKILAFPIFLAIIYAIYYVCLNPSGLGKKLVGITFTWVINAMIWASTTLTELGVWPWLVSLVSDGVIFGVGIVVAFIPYLMILFIFLAILEECGYMARVTFIMDRLFRRFGLSGKSFIPMLLGTGCSVQAIAASRTIENEQDRQMTIFLTPFIPCATMMPTVILVVSLFTKSALVAPLTYLVSIGFVILGGIFLKNTMLKGEPAPFVMELPEYKIPRLKNIWHFVWDRTVSFFRKAATIIFITTVIVWFLKYFSFSFHHVEIGDSMLAGIGKVLEPIFKPLGFGNWQILAALITGFVAKDNFLGTLGQIMGAEMITGDILSTMLPTASAVSFLLFFVLSSPCFASMGAMRKELGSGKLTMKAIGFQMGTAYIVALIAYQILHLVF